MQLDKENINAKAGIAKLFEREGKYDLAYRHICALVEQAPHNLNVLLTFSKIALQIQSYDAAINMLEKALTNNIPIGQEKSTIHFSLADLYDAKHDVTRAFNNYRLANALKQISFDEWEHARSINRLMQTCSEQYFKNAPLSKKGKKRIQPIFIIGVPRSGTSLVEQILSSHPAVHGGGELTFINDLVESAPEMLASDLPYPECMANISQEIINTLSKKYIKKASELMDTNKTVITDKLPGNCFHLGFIQLLFPKAKVIHCIRNPFDTCLSCYFNDFSSPYMGFSYDLRKIGAYYRLHEKLMQHWNSVLNIQILDISYEKLLNSPEDNIRHLLKFCGLIWDRNCLNFNLNKRVVKTASYSQVRKPIYTTSIGRWKEYSEYLSPLKEALENDLIV